MKKIQLLLIEDNKLLRNGLLEILKKQNDIKIIAAMNKSRKHADVPHTIKPDIVLLDFSLRNQNSLRYMESLKKKFPKSKVIVMDLTPVHGDILQFIKAGASGFILKDATLEDFLYTIREVANGKNVLPEIISDSMFSHIVEFAVKEGLSGIKKEVIMTKREKEIIAFVSDGLNNNEIAKKLRISLYTVKSHIHNIMEKLSLHSRLEIANHNSGGTYKIKKQ